MLVPLVSTSLWLLGFRRTLSWVERTARANASGAAAHAASPVIKEGVAAIGRVRRHTPWSGRCLARALSLWWVLRRSGVIASLHLGVRMAGGKLDAHAWVTHNERVLADSDSVWTEFPGTFASDGHLTFGRK